MFRIIAKNMILCFPVTEEILVYRLLTFFRIRTCKFKDYTKNHIKYAE